MEPIDCILLAFILAAVGLLITTVAKIGEKVENIDERLAGIQGMVARLEDIYIEVARIREKQDG